MPLRFLLDSQERAFRRGFGNAMHCLLDPDASAAGKFKGCTFAMEGRLVPAKEKRSPATTRW